MQGPFVYFTHPSPKMDAVDQVADVFSQIWQRATTAQPVPEPGTVLATGVVALVLVWWRPAWQVTRRVVTLVHEAGHALAALAGGRSLHGVRLHRDSSGLTVSRGLPRGWGMVATLVAGYPAPALLGLGGAFVLGQGYAVGLLWLLLVTLALVLLTIRNLFGLWIVLVSGVGLFAVSWWLPAEGQSAFAFTLVWFLLLAAPTTVVELQSARRHGREGHSDADQLGRLTFLPALGWVALFGLVTLGCLAGGAWLLLLRQ